MSKVKDKEEKEEVEGGMGALAVENKCNSQATEYGGFAFGFAHGNGNDDALPAEDKARLRLMEISQAGPPPAEEGTTLVPEASSSPPDTTDEFRRKLVSISYSGTPQPILNRS